MIQILGVKITVFAAYAMLSLQLLAFGSGYAAWRARNHGEDISKGMLSFLFGIISVFCEVGLMTWMAGIR